MTNDVDEDRGKVYSMSLFLIGSSKLLLYVLSKLLLCLFLLFYAFCLLEFVRSIIGECLCRAAGQQADALGQVGDMLVAALWAQPLEGVVQRQQVVDVWAARTVRAVDVLGQGLDVLRADELVVIRGADVHQGPDGTAVGGRRRAEGRVVDGVAVDLADVEILFHLVDLVGPDAIRGAPDPVRGRVVVVRQGLPVGPLEEGDDASGVGGRSSVVLAVGGVLGARRFGLARSWNSFFSFSFVF